MSKLAAQDKFLDLSDYGRPLATLFAQNKKHSIHTHSCHFFWVSGIAIYCILQNQYYLAGFHHLKSIIDGADGELARIKNTPLTPADTSIVF
jgi:hypothetical protein